MKVGELTPLLIVKDGRETLKVSEIYSPNHVSAEVVVPVPARTSVRHYTAEDVERWRTVTTKEYRRYNRLWWEGR